MWWSKDKYLVLNLAQSHLHFLLVLFFILFPLDGFSQKVKEIKPSQIERLNEEKNDSLYVIQAIEISREIHRNSHQEERENYYANLAINRALTMGNNYLYARSLDNLGLLHRYHQQYSNAIQLHERAYHLAKEENCDRLSQMIYANNAGTAARYNEQYDLAVSFYYEALRIAQEDKDLKNIGISSNGLGNALINLSERKNEALAYFEMGLEAERERGESLGMAMNLLSIAQYYIETKKVDQAFIYLEELKAINEKRKDRFGLAMTHEAYGDAFWEQKNQEQATLYYNEALRLYRNYNYPLNAAQVLNRLGKIAASTRNLSQAIVFYDQSLAIADSLNNKSLVRQNAFDIAMVKEKVGDWRNALKFYKIGKDYEDSINLDNQKIKIAALKNQFDWDKTEAKIGLLQKEQELKEKEIESKSLQLRNQKVFIVLLLLGTLLLILFVVAQYRLRKIKFQTQKQLIEKEKDLLQAEYERNMAQAEILISRMQVNPHFIFNCLNAIHLLIQKHENKVASKYLTTFSRFIRLVLEIPKNESISLEEELQIIQYYLKLEEIRFDNQLDYMIKWDENMDLSAVKIPPLLLQPFVENAIWHGLLPSNQAHKRLKIEVGETEHSIEISIEDNGVGMKNMDDFSEGSDEQKKSLGTKITKERIRQFNQSFPDCQIQLKITQGENQVGTKVLLTLAHTISKITKP